MTKTALHTAYKTNEGKRVASVTTLINGNLGWNKQVLINWSVRQALDGQDPDKIKEKAADIGTLAHYLIECHIKEEKPVLKEYSNEHIQIAKNALKAYKQWEKKHHLKYIDSELPLVHEDMLYGGTIDLVAEVDGGICIIDFKTSNNIYPEHIIQVAAYRELYQHVYNKPVQACHILKLSKEDSSFEHHALSNEKLDKAYKAFLDCLDLNDIRKCL